MAPKRYALSEGFWEKVAKRSDSECWQWLGAIRHKGYGQLTRLGVSKKPLRAHRVAWEIAFGPIPDGLFVLHRCDNPGCVNPAHLFLGTNHDNVKDMWAKGRARMPFMAAREARLVERY